MPRIIILNYGLHVSGVSRTLVNFANTLANRGYDITVKLETNDLTLAAELDPHIKHSLFFKEWHIFGHRVRGFLRFYRFFLKILERLPASLQYRLVVRQAYDVEIAFNRGAAARIISASTNKNAKKLVWVHSDFTKTYNPLAGFDSVEDAYCGYAQFDSVVCVSAQVQSSFIKAIGQTKNLCVRHTISDTKKIRRLASKSIPKTTFTLIAVGRLCDAKNYTLLLDTMLELKRRTLDVDLWIVGDGELRESLLRYKEDHCLNNVTFWGEKENPYPYFAAADLYVSSSIYEGLSTTTIEALILGKPTVVTDCTGMRDILGDSQWGVVVPIEVNSLADAIERMVVDNEFRKHYKQQAQIRAKDFDPEECFKRIEELF